jgi:hypothetical protein
VPKGNDRYRVPARWNFFLRSSSLNGFGCFGEERNPAAADLAKRIGARKAYIAVARKFAMIMHRMWIEETDFRFGQSPAAQAA